MHGVFKQLCEQKVVDGTNVDHLCVDICIVEVRLATTSACNMIALNGVAHVDILVFGNSCSANAPCEHPRVCQLVLCSTVLSNIAIPSGCLSNI